MSSMTRITILITAVCRSMAIASGLVLAAHVLAGSAVAHQEPTLKEVIGGKKKQEQVIKQPEKKPAQKAAQ